MRSLIIFVLVIFSKTGADDDIELDAFGVQGISTKFSNGTVSEHTREPNNLTSLKVKLK